MGAEGTKYIGKKATAYSSRNKVFPCMAKETKQITSEIITLPTREKKTHQKNKSWHKQCKAETLNATREKIVKSERRKVFDVCVRVFFFLVALFEKKIRARKQYKRKIK